MPRPRRLLSRPLSRPLSAAGARLLAVPAAVLVLAATGCSGGGSDQPSAGPTSPSTPAPTPLAQVRTTEMTVGRAGFCAQVAPDAVEGALGGAPVRSARWRNGQRAALAPGVSDVAHEFGCRWAGRRGAAASAWVFAPPVTRGEARRLRADALAVPGCRAVPGVPRFGRPTVAVRCTDHGATTVALHGLFGDAWLSCSVTAPTRSSTGLVDRSEQWCVSVALAAAV